MNPALHAEPPRTPTPNPRPPSPEEAAELVDEAAKRHPDWGALVWLAMTTGARRSELRALRWSDIDLSKALIALERALYLDDHRVLREKDTKTQREALVPIIEVAHNPRQREEPFSGRLRVFLDTSGSKAVDWAEVAAVMKTPSSSAPEVGGCDG